MKNSMNISTSVLNLLTENVRVLLNDCKSASPETIREQAMVVINSCGKSATEQAFAFTEENRFYIGKNFTFPKPIQKQCAAYADTFQLSDLVVKAVKAYNGVCKHMAASLREQVATTESMLTDLTDKQRQTLNKKLTDAEAWENRRQNPKEFERAITTRFEETYADLNKFAKFAIENGNAQAWQTFVNSAIPADLEKYLPAGRVIRTVKAGSMSGAYVKYANHPAKLWIHLLVQAAIETGAINHKWFKVVKAGK